MDRGAILGGAKLEPKNALFDNPGVPTNLWTPLESTERPKVYWENTGWCTPNKYDVESIESNIVQLRVWLSGEWFETFSHCGKACPNLA